MRLSTSLLVNRHFTLVFTLTFIFFTGKVNALTEYITVNNPGIEYASLAATATEKGVFINWVTVSEMNNSHFEVERSTDMKSFKTVAIVLDGFTVTGTNGKTYKFKETADDVKKGKTVYYRLKQIDINNHIHYSKVMAVQLNSTAALFTKQQISICKVYTNNQTLLSKQTTISMSEKEIPAIVSITGILNTSGIIRGYQKLCIA